MLHEKPLTWDAARSVLNKQTGAPWLRIDMRGGRRLDERVRLRFRYRLSGGKSLKLALVDSKTKTAYRTAATGLKTDKWSETSVDFRIPAADGDLYADEIHLLLEAGAELLVDDLLLYVPGD